MFKLTQGDHTLPLIVNTAEGIDYHQQKQIEDDLLVELVLDEPTIKRIYRCRDSVVANEAKGMILPVPDTIQWPFEEIEAIAGCEKGTLSKQPHCYGSMIVGRTDVSFSIYLTELAEIVSLSLDLD